MKTKFTIVSLLWAFLLTGQSYLFAQQAVTVIDSTTDGTIKFALVNAQSFKNKDSKTLLKSVLNAGNETQFYLYKVVTDELGMTHEKYQQTFNGIKVEFCEFIVHKDKTGNIVSINGNFAKIPESFVVEPKLIFDEAIKKAETFKKNIKYQVLDLPEEKSIEKPVTKRGDKYEVVIVKGHDNQWHLAYKANLVEDNNIFSNILGYINTESGKIILDQPLVYRSNITGTAATMYSENRTITTDSYSGEYRLRESSRRGTATAIQTYNFNQSPADYISDINNGIANATDFTDNDNNWTASEHDNMFQDQAALDAHWGAEMTFDYFKIVHGRNSYDGNSGLLKSYVHVRTRDDYDNLIDMDNAFWLDSYKAVFYGDGLSLSPFVSLDICSHEIGHAVCNASIGNGSGLIYSGESGALNEGLSDIWGACVEQWATTNKQTWLYGEEVSTWGAGLRSMSNPNASSQPDTYHGTNWDDTDVHTNSGVLNYWFFLLSEGGTDINDLGQSFSVSGIGISKAAKIVYKAETVYMSPTNTFNDARTNTIQAAIALYGRCSEEVQSVTNAWHAVGVGAAWVNPVYDLYQTYTQECNSVTLEVRDYNTWEPITWTTTNGLLLNGNSSPYVVNGNTITISSPSGLNGLVSGTIGDACSTADFGFCPCESWNASISWIWSSPMPGEPLQAEVNPLHPGAMKYKWFVNEELIETTEDGYLSTYNWENVACDGAELSVIGITDCGATIPISGGEFYPICRGFSMASNVNLFPNPTSSEVTVQLEETQDSDKQVQSNNSQFYLSEITQVKVIDKTGITRKVVKLEKGCKSTILNLSDLPQDIYYLEITDGIQYIRKSLVLSK